MRKLLTSALLLGLLTVSCSEADLSGDNNSNNLLTEIDGEASYLTLSITQPGGGRSRAPQGSYNDGTDVENKVNFIRFYFFDQNFDPSPVKKNPIKTMAQGKEVYDSYYDYSPIGNEYGGAVADSTVEKSVNVTLTLNINSKNPPKYVVAIVNPTDSAMVDDATLSQLEGIAAHFLPGDVDKDEDISTNPDYEGKFVMSNSVYASGSNKVNYSKITALSKTPEDAADAANHTIIHVERVVARLDLTIGQTPGSTITPASAKDYEGDDKDSGLVFYTGTDHKLYNAAADDDAEPVFVRFKGWQVTSTPKKANLIKDLKPSWPNELFGTTGGTAKEPWNVEVYHRSFWAHNPQLKGAADKTETPTTDFLFYKYDEINLPFSTDDKPKTVYIHENAAENGKDAVKANHETKVIVAAELVDKTGEPMTIVEYGYKFYEKNDLLSYFADNIWLYSSDDADPENKLTSADLDFASHKTYVEDAGANVKGGYFSYVTIAENSRDKDWYDAEGNAIEGLTAVNAYINDHLDSRILIWENGLTYYYFTIRHLGSGTDEEPGTGYYGVVRNHIYKADISKIAGLGTPVFNKEEIIYPEKPDREGSIFAAEVKILSWRVVSQDYEFSW